MVVIDEFPYLAEGDPSIEATFQKQWNRLLGKKAVLLVVAGVLPAWDAWSAIRADRPRRGAEDPYRLAQPSLPGLDA